MKSGEFKKNIILFQGASAWEYLCDKVGLPPILARHERQVYVLVNLVVSSLLAVLVFLFLSLFSIQSNYSALISTLSVLVIFALLQPWLEAALERVLRPEQLVYRQFVEEYGQVVRGAADLSALLPYVSRILYETLQVSTTTIWFYCAEESLLTLVYTEGILPDNSLGELPVDLELKQLHGTQPVSTVPESALRRGLMALGIETVASLSLRHELVGLIGLGSSRHGQSHRLETLRVLDLLAGQLALAVKNSRLIADLAETLNKLQLAYRRTIDTQEEERRSLAIELHDDILSRLTTMGMTLRQSQRQLPGNPTQVQAWLEILEQETRYLNGRLREITQGLHPTILTDLGLIAALQAYIDSLTKHALPTSAPRTIDLTTQGFGEVRIKDQKLERDLYYITRQAVDNALKHAQADQIFIHLRWRDDAITVAVQDTGVGMKSAPELLMGQQGHLGLLSMHERALAWRGQLNFQSTSGRGTTVYARLPISQPSPNPTHLQAFTHYLRY